MRRCLKTSRWPSGAGLLALAVCLLAPPLHHNHHAHHVPLATVLGAPCPSAGALPHLHAADTRPAHVCPACAAGPTWAGEPTCDEVLLAAHTAEELLASGNQHPVGSALPPEHSRAPPSRIHG